MALITWKDIFERKMILISLASLYATEIQIRASEENDFLCRRRRDDGGDKEGNSLKIRSGRRWRNKVSRGKFEGVYSRVGFIPPCILYISSGGSFRSGSCSGENQEITEKDEREARARDEKREGEEGRDESAQPNIIIQRAEKRRFRVEISWGAKLKLVFVHYSFARLRRRPN